MKHLANTGSAGIDALRAALDLGLADIFIFNAIMNFT